MDPLVIGIRDRWEDRGLAGSPWPFMSLCAISRLDQILKKALGAELKRLGLGRTAYFLLTGLALRTKGRARLSTLSRLLMMHPTSVRSTVDQLEANGLVRTHPHPHDRRATVVEITDAGRDLVDETNQALASPDGAMAVFGEYHKDLFAALQPARHAAGDMEL